MAWAWWLAVPIGATLLAAFVTWLHGWRAERRARRRPSVDVATASHREYLDALAIPARGQFRVAAPDVSLGEARVAQTEPAETRASGTALDGR